MDKMSKYQNLLIRWNGKNKEVMLFLNHTVFCDCILEIKI